MVDRLHTFLSGIVYGEPVEMEEVPVECEECTVKVDSGPDRLAVIEQRVDYMMDVKHSFLDSNLTLETLAKEIGTNRTYVSRVFNQKKNMGFEAYLNKLRLKYASSIAYRDLEVEDMAIECGFPSLRTFYKSLLDTGDDECYLLKIGRAHV